MQPNTDDLKLPRFSRPIGVIVRDGRTTVTGTQTGVLPSFSGLLDVRLDRTDRPMADLSYLSLTGLVDEAIAETGGTRDGGERVEREDGSDPDAEPTVRDVLRSDRSSEERPSAGGAEADGTTGRTDGSPDEGGPNRDPDDGDRAWNVPEDQGTVGEPATLLDLDPVADVRQQFADPGATSDERAGGPPGDQARGAPDGRPEAATGAGPDTTVLDPFEARGRRETPAGGTDAAGPPARTAADTGRFDAGGHSAVDDGPLDVGERPRLTPADAPGSTSRGSPGTAGGRSGPGTVDGPSLSVRRDAGGRGDRADDGQTGPDDGPPGRVDAGGTEDPQGPSEDVPDPVEWLRDDDAASRRFVDELHRKLERKAAIERDREGR